MPSSIVRNAFHLAALAALLAIPARAAAQQADPHKILVGVGGGVSRVSQTEGDADAIAPLIHARVGYAVRPQVAVMLELTQAGVGASVDDSAGVSGGKRRLAFTTLLASVQLGRPEQVYIRPGVGVGSNTFTVYEPQANDVYIERASHEGGLAAGIAVGHEFAIPGFPIAIEGSALWSGGEDSTSPRVSLGVQLVATRRF